MNSNLAALTTSTESWEVNQ